MKIVLKKISANIEKIAVNVPAEVNGKNIFDGCYPWQVYLLATMWCYHCLAYEAAKYMQYTGRDDIHDKLLTLATAFCDRFKELSGIESLEDNEEDRTDICQFIKFNPQNETSWEKQDEYIRGQINDVVIAMALFMKTHGMNPNLAFALHIQIPDIC